MSYSPGDLITCGDEQVLVLTEGKVLYKMLGGRPHREIISLADWLIICGDQPRICATQEPVEPVEPVAQQPSFPNGTVFTWRQDENNYAKAIQLKNGAILQVKEVVNSLPVYQEGTYRLVKTTFATYEAWRASRTTGEFTHTVYENAKKQPIVAANDAEKVRLIMERYKIRTSLYARESANQQMERCTRSITDYKKYLLSISLEEELELPHIRRSAARNLKRTLNQIRHLKARMATMTEEQKVFTPMHIYSSGTGRLEAFIEGSWKIIGYDRTTQMFSWNTKCYRTFAECGIARRANGEPELRVIYRRQEILV